MPVETMNASEALRTLGKNKTRSWPASARGQFSRGDAFFEVRHTPKWQMNADDVVFTIGSCFARNVEAVLSSKGIAIAQEGLGIEPEHFESFDEATGVGGGQKGRVSGGAFNKYTVSSMTHDVRRVLRNEVYPNDGLIELNDGKWFDPHASGLKTAPLDVALRNRRILSDAIATVRNASVIFITMGLSEGWIDLETGLAMNRHPGSLALRSHGSRFQFVNYNHDEIVSDLQEMIALIREIRADMRFVVTVSPVPFAATMRSVDVVVANTYSKSVLRAAAETVTAGDDLVDYFPSYEIVINSPRDLAWKDDQTHVAMPMVRHVMQIFQNTYFADSVQAVG